VDFNLPPHASNYPVSMFSLENFKTIATARERAESGIPEAVPPPPAPPVIPPHNISESEPQPKRIRRSKWD
jgi:hypothetical protein